MSKTLKSVRVLFGFDFCFCFLSVQTKSLETQDGLTQQGPGVNNAHQGQTFKVGLTQQGPGVNNAHQGQTFKVGLAYLSTARRCCFRVGYLGYYVDYFYYVGYYYQYYLFFVTVIYFLFAFFIHALDGAVVKLDNMKLAVFFNPFATCFVSFLYRNLGKTCTLNSRL